MIDFAYCMRDLVDIHFPDAEKIMLMMYNLNIHRLDSLYEAFEPAEARRIIGKLFPPPWYERRNQKQSTVNRHFTTDDARIKLHRLYPTIVVC